MEGGDPEHEPVILLQEPALAQALAGSMAADVDIVLCHPLGQWLHTITGESLALAGHLRSSEGHTQQV